MTERTGRRARLRAATMQELKDAAWAELQEHGAVALSLRSVAGRMGMSPAGLYRYVNSREDLLTLLIAEAYDDLGVHVRAALDAAHHRDVSDRLRAVATAYRAWSVASPQCFGLLFGDPIPGYAAPPGGPTVEAMRTFALALAEPLLDAWAEGRITSLPPITSPLAEQLAPMAEVAQDAPPKVHALLLLTWGRLHGQISLEVFGHHAWLFPDGCAELFAAEVDHLLRQLGVLDGAADADLQVEP
jgi:AcrR family transcriptional regulator